MIELKVAAGYIRRYRDDVGKHVTLLGTEAEREATEYFAANVRW